MFRRTILFVMLLSTTLLLGVAILLAPGAVSSAQGPTLLPDDGLRLLPANSLTSGEFVPGRLLVRLAPGVERGTIPVLRGLDVQPLTADNRLGIYRVRVEAGQELQMAAALNVQPTVLYAEPDYLFHMVAPVTTTPNDGLYGDYQWNLRHIHADDAWDITTGSDSVTIAIVDTGVDLTHPDLASKIVSGWDTINNDNDPSDDNGHGTHVASIAAAASNNGTGIAGVSWGGQIMPIKVLDSTGNGSSSDIAQGIEWAVDHGAHIINMSLGGNSFSSSLLNAVNYAYNHDVLVVAASGNSFQSGNPTTYPAAYEHVLGVAATDDSDHHARYSNSGNYVDVAAPGGDPDSNTDPNDHHWILGAYWRGSGSNYAWLSGTSQATPHVAGLAALLLSLDASLTPDELTTVITDTALDTLTLGWDEFSGYGRIDVAAAVDAISQPEPTNTPTVTPTPLKTVTPDPDATATTTPSPESTATATPSPEPTTTPSAQSQSDIRVNNIMRDVQSEPAIASDRLGNVVAIWRDRRYGADALYMSVRSPIASDWGRNAPISGTQQISSTERIGPPAVGIGLRGEVFAVWHDDLNGDDDLDVYFSRKPVGQRDWNTPVQISDDSSTPLSQRNPDIAIAPDGTIDVVWEGDRAGGPKSGAASVASAIYWRRLLPDASAWTPSTAVDPLPAGVQEEPAVAAGDDGAVYAVWVERHQNQAHIVSARKSLTSTGWITGTVVAVANANLTSYAPDIALDAAGNVTVVWADVREAGRDADIYARTFLVAEETWTPIHRVNHDAGHHQQRAPRLAAGPNELAVVWEDDRADNPDIFVAWRNAGALQWSPARQANAMALDAGQTLPDVVVDREGNTYVVWVDDRNLEVAPDVYSRRFAPSERFVLYLPSLSNVAAGR